MPTLMISPEEVIELCLKTQGKINEIQHLTNEVRHMVEYLNYAVQDVSCVNKLYEMTVESYSSSMTRLSYTDDALKDVIYMMNSIITMLPPTPPIVFP